MQLRLQRLKASCDKIPRCVEAAFQPSLWTTNKWRRHIKGLSHRQRGRNSPRATPRPPPQSCKSHSHMCTVVPEWCRDSRCVCDSPSIFTVTLGCKAVKGGNSLSQCVLVKCFASGGSLLSGLYQKCQHWNQIFRWSFQKMCLQAIPEMASQSSLSK